MSRPWMPLYIADYLQDTAHLGALESGGYLHLIMHYWANEGLPADDVKLARIARMTAKEWAANKETLQAFFYDGWKHKRIDAELAAANEKYERRAKAGKKGGNAKATAKQNPSNATSNDQALLYQPQPPSVSKETGVPPSDPKSDYFRRVREVLGVSGGGLGAKILRSFGDEDDPKAIAKARARIEDASTKSKPVEWLGRVMAGPARAVDHNGDRIPEGII